MAAAKHSLAIVPVAPSSSATEHPAPKLRSFDLHRSLATLVTQFRSIIGPTTTLELHNASHAIPLIHGDEAIIARAITTLLCHSLHCLHEQPGTISARAGLRFFGNAKKQDPYFFVEVSDTGSISHTQRLAALNDPESVLRNIQAAADMHAGDIIIEQHADITRTWLLLSAANTASGRVPKSP